MAHELTAWVEHAHGRPVRIFRNYKQAILAGVPLLEMPLAEATGAIRRQVYEDCNGECLRCGKPLACEGQPPGYEEMEMHERLSRGKQGLVSIWNSVASCHNCHTVGPHSEHGNRLPRFGEERRKL